MIKKTYAHIMRQDEKKRANWALGLSISVFSLILVGFAFQKGYINVGNNQDSQFVSNTSKSNVASVIEASSAPSPLENTRQTIDVATSQIKNQYKSFLDSVSAVLVPFVSGIDVYERK